MSVAQAEARLAAILFIELLVASAKEKEREEGSPPADAPAVAPPEPGKVSA